MFYEEIDGNFCICGFFCMVLFEDHDNWKELAKSNQVDFQFHENIGPSMKEVAQWCEDNLKDGWLVGVSTSAFYNKNDAMAFKLRWV